MLAEKFFLVLETLRSHASDGSVKVISTAPHVPANVLPSQKSGRRKAGTPDSVTYACAARVGNGIG
jgi:hypothetical protein